MKIAITGAHRTGKTSLAEKLQELLPEYILFQEPYYEMTEAGFEFAETLAPEDYITQLEYSIKQLNTEEENVILDRCPLDLLAYIQAVNESDEVNIQPFYQQVQFALDEIDLLVFIGIEHPDIVYCAKTDLPGLRYQVNEILEDWIHDFETEILEVKGSLLARAGQVMKRLSAI